LHASLSLFEKYGPGTGRRNTRKLFRMKNHPNTFSAHPISKMAFEINRRYRAFMYHNSQKEVNTLQLLQPTYAAYCALYDNV